LALKGLRIPGMPPCTFEKQTYNIFINATH